MRRGNFPKIPGGLGGMLLVGVVVLALAAGFVITRAATGVPRILNQQGRLFDSSGNLLGGAGTDYCFRFSIYDDAAVGAPDNKLWPAGTPSAMTVRVKNGLFSAGIGDVAAGGDALDFDFQSSDNAYLNIEIANKAGGVCQAFETLSPRQRIVSAGYAINSGSVGGFQAAQNASGSQIPVLQNGNLVLGGTNPQIGATGSNTLLLQGNASGSIQFFNSGNYVSATGTARFGGDVNVGGGLNINSLSFLNATGTGNLQVQTLKTLGSSDLQGFTFTDATSTGNLQIGSLNVLNGSVVQGLTFANATSTGNLQIGSLSVINAGTFGSVSSTAITFTNATGTANLQTQTFTALGASALQGFTFTNATSTGNLQVQSLNVLATSTLQGFTFTNATGTGNLAANSLTISGISGSTQCLQADSNGKVSGAGVGCAPIVKSTSSIVSRPLGATETSTLNIAITPTNTSTDVWVIATAVANLDATNVNRTVTFRIRRGADCTGTQVGTDVSVMLNDRNSANNSAEAAMSFVDSPASTTAQMYQLCAVSPAGAPTVTARQLTLQMVNSGADLAEVYGSEDPTLAPGEVVSMDVAHPEEIIRSSQAYDGNAIGVVSTRPSLLMGGGSTTGTRVIVALSGRVPVKVSAENGDINAGDYLVPAGTPGMAMKATRPASVIGQAMTGFSGTATGTIVAFIRNAYYDGSKAASSSVATVQAVDSIGTDTPGALKEMAAMVSTVAGKLFHFVADKISAAVAVVGKLFAKDVAIVPGGTLEVPAGDNEMSGSGLIPAGMQEIVITNSAATNGSKIFLTPRVSLREPLAVTEKAEGHFRVSMVAPQSEDVPFDWFIIRTNDISSSPSFTATPVAPLAVAPAPVVVAEMASSSSIVIEASSSDAGIPVQPTSSAQTEEIIVSTSTPTSTVETSSTNP